MVEIKLGQGDTDDVPVILWEDTEGADLTGSTVKLLLTDQMETIGYEITCVEGIRDPITNEIITAFSAGGITVPLTSVHTAVPGFYIGQFIVTIGSRQATFEKVDGYLVMEVRKKLYTPPI